MVKQRQTTQPNNKTKRGRRKLPNGYITMVPRGLPSRFPSAPGDQTSINFKSTILVTVPSGSGTVGDLLVMGVGTGVPNVAYLSEVSQLFAANIQCYSRWMIEKLTVQLRATGVGGSANTFVAASYIPSNTSQDAVPTSLSEVSQAINYAESALGTVGQFTTKPCDYYNDWRMSDNGDPNDKQAGLIQIYGSGPGGSSSVTAGVLTVSGVIHFCGLRK